MQYLGLDLKNPFVASSSPLTASIEKIEELYKAGIGAVVLKSIFEEQITGEAAVLRRYNDYAEAAAYLRTYIGSDYVKSFTELIKEAKQRTDIPVIASINCATEGKWMDYARKIQEAGADALELNVFFLPTNPKIEGNDIVDKYLHLIEKVVSSVNIPVSVKLSMRFTNILNVTQQIYFRRAKGVVMYNRFFEPDIDIDKMEYVPADGLSSPKELHNSLRDIAVTSAIVPGLDISASTGIHSGEDAVKAILAGAKTVQLCSTILKNGMGAIGRMNDFVVEWMDRNTFDDVSDFCGLMNKKERLDDPALERVQYMKYFPGNGV